jgi:hypothetical protein
MKFSSLQGKKLWNYDFLSLVGYALSCDGTFSKAEHFATAMAAANLLVGFDDVIFSKISRNFT